MRTLSRFALALLFGVFALCAAAPAPAQQLPAAGEQMPNATGASASLASLAGDNATAVLFWSNQCPWTKKYEDRVLDLARSFEGQGVQFVLVNSNSAADFPQESLAASQSQAGNFPVPYLKDESGRVAEAFDATRTPHVFVYNGQGQLAYSGAIDDSPGDPSSVKKPYLENALDALTNGRAPATAQTNAFGCVLKK